MHSVIEDIITEEKSNIFEPDIIKAGFQHTGIWPFNSDLITSKFQHTYLLDTEPQLHTTEEDQVNQVAMLIREVMMPNQQNVPPNEYAPMSGTS